jgi:hypothetical protein
MDNDNFDFNLLEKTTFTTGVSCSLPGNGADVRRPFDFKATFELMAQNDWEDLVNDESKSTCVARVLKSTEGVPGGTITGQDGESITLSGMEVALRNPITCDALFTKYHLYITEDGRNAIHAAAERKNSKRSRRR